MRPAGSSSRRQIVFVSIVVGGVNFGTAVAVPVLPLHAFSLGAPASAVGLLVALFGLGRLLANVPAGHLVERFPAKALLVGAGLVGAAASALVAASGSVGSLLVLRFVNGLAAGTAVTVAQMSLILIDAESSARAFGYLLSAQFAAGALGPVVGGVVADAESTRAAFVVAGGVGLACSLAAAWGLRLPGVGAAKGGDGDGAPSLDRRLFVGVCIAGAVVVLARYAGEHVLIPVLAYGEAGISPRDLGLTFGLVGVANVGLVVLSSRVGDRIGHRAVVIASLTVYAALLLGFLVVDEAGPVLVLVVVGGLVTAFSATSPTAYLLDMVAGRRGGPAIGIFRTAGDLAALVGAYAMGSVIEHADDATAVVALAVVVFSAAGSFTVLTGGRYSHSQELTSD